MNKEEFVLFTASHQYVVEYLFNELALSKSITEAKRFDNLVVAKSFKDIILKEREIECSVNTFI